MTKRDTYIQKWRELTKKLIVESLGGKCCICGYNKCYASLACHHIESDEKDFGLSKMMVSPRRWDLIIIELRKCVLICNNCHGEIHHGNAVIPVDAPRFDEAYTIKNPMDLEEKSPCIICGQLKSARLITCSRKCAAKNTKKIKWELYDLKDMIQKYTYDQIGEMLGCSDAAVIKRAKKLGVYIQKLKLNKKDVD